MAAKSSQKPNGEPGETKFIGAMTESAKSASEKSDENHGTWITWKDVAWVVVLAMIAWRIFS
jgi:hypothetical protein